MRRVPRVKAGRFIHSADFRRHRNDRTDKTCDTPTDRFVKSLIDKLNGQVKGESSVSCTSLGTNHICLLAHTAQDGASVQCFIKNSSAASLYYSFNFFDYQIISLCTIESRRRQRRQHVFVNFYSLSRCLFCHKLS